MTGSHASPLGPLLFGGTGHGGHDPREAAYGILGRTLRRLARERESPC